MLIFRYQTLVLKSFFFKRSTSFLEEARATELIICSVLENHSVITVQLKNSSGRQLCLNLNWTELKSTVYLINKVPEWKCLHDHVKLHRN